jgi:hypothetical protein
MEKKKKKRTYGICYVMLNFYRLLRQSIHDASDLVSKRRKSPRNALAAWKASRISILPQVFLEPLIPCKFAMTIFSVVQLLCYLFLFKNE